MVVDDIQKESFKYAVVQYLDAISGLIGLIIYTSVLSVTDVGLYFTGLAVFIIGSAGSRGLYDAVKKKGSEDDKNLSTYFSIALVGTVLYTIIVIALTTTGYVLLKSGSLPIEYNIPIALLYGIIIRFVASGLFRSLVTAYDGEGNIATGGYYNLLRGLLETVLQIGLILLVEANIFYLFLGSAVSTVIISGFMIKDLSHVNIKRFSKSDVISIKDFGLWNSLSSTLLTVEHRLVTIILALVNPAIAGIYGAVIRTTKPALYVPSSLSQTLFIETSFRKSKDESISDKIPMATKYASVLSIPMLFGAIGFSTDILSVLYSGEFSEGGPILISMSIAVIMRSQSYILSGYLYGSDMAKSVTKSTAINFVASISILLVGIQLIGLDALLISLVVSRFLHLIYLYRTVKSICEFSLNKDTIYQFIASALMLAMIYGQKTLFNMDSYVVVVFVSINAVLYFAFLMILDNEFYKMVSEKISGYV